MANGPGIASSTVGILPVKNMLGGLVLHERDRQKTNLDMIKRTGAQVLGVIDIQVKHCLLGLNEIEPNDLHGRTVHSKDQALLQCSRTIAARGLIVQEALSTCAAAVALARGELGPNALVIAPCAASELYGLSIIEENVSDLPPSENITVVAVVGSSDPRGQRST